MLLSSSAQRSIADLTSASSKREPMVFRGSAKSITCGWMLSLCNEAMAAAKCSSPMFRRVDLNSQTTLHCLLTEEEKAVSVQRPNDCG